MKLTRHIFLLFIFILTLSFSFTSTTCHAKSPTKQKVHIADLEGRWKVVSTTWGGDPKDFIGGVFKIKFLKTPVKTKDSPTQFIVKLDSINTIWDINAAFCAMQYELQPDNFTLYSGYNSLMFWQLSDYPCGMEKLKDSNDDIKDYVQTEGPKYLIRMKLEAPRIIKALVYYEYGFAASTLEENLNDSDKDERLTKCEKSICHISGVIGTGVFEMTLKKI